MEKYSPEKRKDRAFIAERKGEFFPEEEFGDEVRICTSCAIIAEEYLREKKPEQYKQFLERNKINLI